MQNYLKLYFIHLLYILKMIELQVNWEKKNQLFLCEVQNSSFSNLIVIFEILCLLSDGVVLLICHKESTTKKYAKTTDRVAEFKRV